jgi:hypothetical protein
LIIAIAFTAYVFDRDDIVWRYIRESPASREWEHFIFSLATLLVGAGTAFCIRARATSAPAIPGTQIPRDGRKLFFRYPQQIGDLLFVIGIATLAPLSGAIFLAVGETLRDARLILLQRENKASPQLAGTSRLSSQLVHESVQPVLARCSTHKADWRRAFRREAARWGIFLTMAAFTVTLIDRLAEALAALSILFATLLNRMDRGSEAE